MKTNIYYVYLHRRASDNKPFYVGKGKNTRSHSTFGRNKRWNNTYKKHGLIVEILYDNLSEEDAFNLEKDTITEMKYHFEDTLCNMTDGGEGVSGYKWNTLENHVSNKMRGRKHTPEHCAKISEANKGRKLPHKAAIAFKEWNDERCLPSKVFTFMTRYLRNRNQIPLAILSSIVGIPEAELRRKPAIKPEVPRLGVEKSANNRRGKPPHNKGKRQASTAKENNPSADLKVYTFIHDSGDMFIGTRYQLCDAYPYINLNTLGKLFYTKPILKTKGWRLLKE